MSRVLAVIRGQLDRARARLDVRQGPDAALGLGDDLVGDHDHVLAGDRLRCRCGDQGREVVSRSHLRQALNGDRGDRAHAMLRASWLSMPRVCAAPPRDVASAFCSSARSSGVSTSSASEPTFDDLGLGLLGLGMVDVALAAPGPERGGHRLRRCEQQRVGAGAMAVGHDQRRSLGHGPREQLLELLWIEHRAVSGDKQRSVRSRHQRVADAVERRDVVAPVVVVEHHRAVAARDPLRAVVGGDDDGLVDRSACA